MPDLSGGDDGDVDDKQRSPNDKSFGEFLPEPMPIAPDGGIVPGYAIPRAASPYNEDDFVCLRGPCRHFWLLKISADDGAAEGTYEALGVPAPRVRHATCLVHPGVETVLSFDAPVLECSRWDPMAPSEVAMLEARREICERERASRVENQVAIGDVVDDGGNSAEEFADTEDVRSQVARAWFGLGVQAGGGAVASDEIDEWFKAAWDLAAQAAKGNYE